MKRIARSLGRLPPWTTTPAGLALPGLVAGLALLGLVTGFALGEPHRRDEAGRLDEAHRTGEPYRPDHAHRPDAAHRSGEARRSASAPEELAQERVPYDGRFTFTRIRYGGVPGGYGRGWGRSAWAHDYPAADRNMQTMLNEFTAMRASTSGSNVFRLDDPEIFRSPVLYISEPGFWSVTEEDARNLRAYLLKGGFLIFDDFEARQWDNMAAQLARALPEGRWFELDASHPVFGTFFHVEDIYVPHPLVRVTPRYMAVFEDNDPSKRIMVLANHNSDLAEYWEYAARGYFPVDPTNDAFRLGINYLIYGVTR